MSPETKPLEHDLKQPRRIAEGILMYPDKLDMEREMIENLDKGGYVVVIEDQGFILNIS